MVVSTPGSHAEPCKRVHVEPMLPHEAEAVAGLIRTITAPSPP